MTIADHVRLHDDFLIALAARNDGRGKMARVLDLLMTTATEWPRRGIWHYPCRRRMTETRIMGGWRYRP